MKFAIVLLAVIAIAISENCTNNQDCTATACSGTNGGQVICANSLCTCVVKNNATDTDIPCTTTHDCDNDNHDCFNHQPEHCVNHVCHCTHTPNNGGHHVGGDHGNHNPGGHHG